MDSSVMACAYIRLSVVMLLLYAGVRRYDYIGNRGVLRSQLKGTFPFVLTLARDHFVHSGVCLASLSASAASG